MDLTWLPRATREQHPTLELRRDWDTSWGAADIVRRCALFTTWHPLLLGCEPFQSCITGGRAEHQSRQSLQASGVAADLARGAWTSCIWSSCLCSNFHKGWRFWRAARTVTCVCRKPRPFDLMKESRTVGHDGRATLLPFEAVTFALQANQPTRG